MDSFLSLDADEVCVKEEATRRGRIRIPPSIRTRTISGLGRRTKRPATSQTNYCEVARCSQTTLTGQIGGDTTKRFRTQIDELRARGATSQMSPHIESSGLAASQENINTSPTTLKWLEVSESLTPVVNIGTTSASSKASSNPRHSAYLRQSWKLSNNNTNNSHGTATTTTTSGIYNSSMWCSQIFDKEEVLLEMISSKKKVQIRPQTADPFARHKVNSLAETMGQDDGECNDTSFMVDDPTTGGKVALRSLALLSRPISREGLGQCCRSGTSVGNETNSSAALTMDEGHQMGKKNKKCHEDNVNHNAIHEEEVTLFDTSTDLQKLELVRPDSPTLPTMMQEVQQMDEISKKMSNSKKVQPSPRVSFILTPSARIPQEAGIVTRKKSSWTTRLKQAFSHKSSQSPVQCC